jgi:hypothetical protein
VIGIRLAYRPSQRPNSPKLGRAGWSDCWRRKAVRSVENADKSIVQFAQKKENKFALGIIVEKRYSK